MKIINRLTLRSMRRNRRRTIVTGIGITLAVCLIASICTLASTLLQMTKDSTLIHTGSWQLRFDNIPFEKLGELSGAEGVDSVGVMRELGVIGDGSSDPQKAHFSVWSADEEAAALFQLTPQQGRLPQKEGELVAAPYSNYAIGDKVTLYPERRLSIYEDEDGNEVTLFESEKADTEGLIGPIRYEYEKAGEGREYTVVGLASPSTVHLGQTLFAAVYFDKAALQPGDTVSVLATFKNLDKSVFSHGAALARSLEADPQYNTMLLGCYGLSEDMNYLLLFFAAGILAAALIAFSAGFFVYNAFSISLSERIRDLGLLSSVGATKRQKYHSVLFEASLYGLVCVALGILLGVGLVGLGVRLFGETLTMGMGIAAEQAHVTISWISVASSVIVGGGMLFFSALRPAKKASRVSPVEAIRRSGDFTAPKRRGKSSKLAFRLLGAQGALGISSMRRSPKRHRSVVSSLSVSLALFLSLFAAFSYVLSSSGQSYGAGADVSVYLHDKTADSNKMDNIPKSERDAIYREILALDGVAEAVISSRFDCEALLSPAFLNDRLKEEVDEMMTWPEEERAYGYQKDGRVLIAGYLIALDDASFKQYAAKCGLDGEALLQSDTPQAIVWQNLTYRDPETRELVHMQMLKAKPGDGFSVTVQDKNQKTHSLSLNIAGFSRGTPAGVDVPGFPDQLAFFCSERTLYQFTKDIPFQTKYNKSGAAAPYISLSLRTGDSAALAKEIEKLNQTDKYPGVQIYAQDEHYIEKINTRDTAMLQTICTAFCVLIFFICLSNIINTVTTSMSLRRREFAVYKSAGMTPGQLRRMMLCEGLVYGLKTLLYGLPVSFALMYAFYKIFSRDALFPFYIPWGAVLIGAAAVVVLTVTLTVGMSRGARKESIIEVLKDETT